MDKEGSSSGESPPQPSVDHVINRYYVKFSENRDLRKYFCGSTVPSTSRSNQEVPPISPASSVASNRRLEWDNGADIGYENTGDGILYKSFSLPTLTPESRPRTVIRNSSVQNLDVLTLLKSKMGGSPTAESTPISATLTANSTNRKLMVPEKPPRKVGTVKRTVNLTVTKPIIVECIPECNVVDQFAQTSLISNETKSIQTDTKNQVIVIESSNSDSQCDSFKYVCPGATTSSTELQKPYSRTLIGDLDKTLELLEQLLRTHKTVTGSTKKRYIKQIVQKILESSYIDDSTTTTTSSELFQPKKSPLPKHNNSSNNLQNNVPWYPAPTAALTTNTFSYQYPPKKNRLFTLPSVPVQNTSGTTSSTNSSSLQHWKNDKTVSERQFESGDQLMQYAIYEREYQLDWIGNEIAHLTELKLLLEKKKPVMPTAMTSTAIYMVHGQNTGASGSTAYSTAPSGDGRQYVIQTELSSSGSTSGQMDLQLNTNNDNNTKKNEQYRVCNVNHSNGGTKRITGNVQVSSDTKGTTNIYVKARSQSTKEPLCKCGTKKYVPCPNQVRFPTESEEKPTKKELEVLYERTAPSRQCKCTNTEPETSGTETKTLEYGTASENQRKDQNTQTNGTQTNCDKSIQVVLSSESKNTVTSSEDSTVNSSDSSQFESFAPEFDLSDVVKCSCCSKRTPSEELLTKLTNDILLKLCAPCYQYHTTKSVNFGANQQASMICQCYTVVRRDTINEIKKTVKELSDTYQQDDDSCTTNCQCCHCRDLDRKKRQGGIAYLLTFEDGTDDSSIKQEKKRHLQEIRVKVPSLRNSNSCKRKSHKNNTNNQLTKKQLKSLDVYLKDSRPGFISDADRRRKHVTEAKLRRQQYEEFNKLLFLKENKYKNGSADLKQLFSTEEMRRITWNNYQKLPEVREKCRTAKRQQLKEANRLLANLFNEKLRSKVLKGNPDLPIHLNVLNSRVINIKPYNQLVRGQRAYDDYLTNVQFL